MYSKKVMQHFEHPKNVGVMKNPSGFGEKGNLRCGDVMDIYIKVENGIIKDIKFKTFGCVAAIASTSILTEMVKGKTIEQAEKITKDDVVKEMGELPPVKLHCSLLAVDALKEAIKDYKGKGKEKDGKRNKKR
jgi:nitrogen fixation NifU-like protein